MIKGDSRRFDYFSRSCIVGYLVLKQVVTRLSHQTNYTLYCLFQGPRYPKLMRLRGRHCGFSGLWLAQDALARVLGL